MKKKNINRVKLSERLKVSKGYVSQIFNAGYDHKISKLVELALSCNTIPLIFFVDKDEYVRTDAKDQIYELMPVQRPINITYTEIESSNLQEESKSEFESIKYIYSSQKTTFRDKVPAKIMENG